MGGLDGAGGLARAGGMGGVGGVDSVDVLLVLALEVLPLVEAPVRLPCLARLVRLRLVTRLRSSFPF